MSDAPHLDPIAVSIEDACRMIGMSRREIYRRIGAGDIQARKPGRRTIVLVNSLREYVQRLPAPDIRAA